uniref:hypothetical protein n=1 Tax=Aminiphilus sp. TaxID=1872488 RepID=UPI002619BE16
SMHDPQLNNLCIFRVKKESAYGNDANPADGLTPLLIASGAEPEIEGDVVERNVVQSTYTPRGSILGAKRQPFKFSIEAHGGLLDVGGSVQPPDYGPILEACGMQKTAVHRIACEAQPEGFITGETVIGSTSAATGVVQCLDDSVLVLRGVVGEFEEGETLTGSTSAATTVAAAEPVPGIEYRPVTSRMSAQSSALGYLYLDHVLYLLKGWRGTFELTGEAGKPCMLNFTGTALWTRPADVPDLPAVVPADIVPPRLERAGARLGAYAPVFKGVTFSLGGTLAPREDANSPEGIAEYYLGGRKPVIRIDPEQDKLANWDPYALWEQRTKLPLGLTVGQEPGNRFRLHAPLFQIDKPGGSPRGSIRAYQIEGTCTGSGDDEFRLTYF